MSKESDDINSQADKAADQVNAARDAMATAAEQYESIETAVDALRKAIAKHEKMGKSIASKMEALAELFSDFESLGEEISSALATVEEGLDEVRKAKLMDHLEDLDAAAETLGEISEMDFDE